MIQKLNSFMGYLSLRLYLQTLIASFLSARQLIFPCRLWSQWALYIYSNSDSWEYNYHLRWQWCLLAAKQKQQWILGALKYILLHKNYCVWMLTDQRLLPAVFWSFNGCHWPTSSLIRSSLSLVCGLSLTMSVSCLLLWWGFLSLWHKCSCLVTYPSFFPPPLPPPSPSNPPITVHSSARDDNAIGHYSAGYLLSRWAGWPWWWRQ